MHNIISFLSDGEIEEYGALGPKNYQCKIRTADECNIITKVRGFALRCSSALSCLDGNKFVEFVVMLLQGIRRAVAVPQFNILRTPRRDLYNTINCKILRNDVFKQRVAFAHSPVTLPYGWTEDLYNAHIKRE